MAITTVTIQHKRGDTLDLAGLARMEDGTAADMTGWTGLSQIRYSDDSLIEILSFEWLDAATGACRIYSANSTSSWPLGNAYFDLELTTDTGKIVSSPTVTVLICKDITR